MPAGGAVRWVALGGAFIVIASTAGCQTREVVVTLTRDEIQARISPRFPVVKSALLVKVTLQEPRVMLKNGTDRIGIDMTVNVAIPLLSPLSGRIEASGVPRYDPESKAFYLDRATIERLEVSGLKPEHEGKVRAVAEKIAAEVLATRPIYELKGRNLKEVTASFVLRDVIVRDGRVQATLALP